MNTENRFWRKVKKTNTCWLWLGAISDNGYGHFINEIGSQVLVHRWIWERYKGKIPVDWEIHHNPTCPKNCVNYESHLIPMSKSAHRRLEPPTRKDNKCWLGHEMTEENTYMDRQYKLCRACRAIASKKASTKRRIARFRAKLRSSK